jgi:hypothetical protein
VIVCAVPRLILAVNNKRAFFWKKLERVEGPAQASLQCGSTAAVPQTDLAQTQTMRRRSTTQGGGGGADTRNPWLCKPAPRLARPWPAVVSPTAQGCGPCTERPGVRVNAALFMVTGMRCDCRAGCRCGERLKRCGLLHSCSPACAPP